MEIDPLVVGPAHYNGTDVIEIINRYKLGFELGNVIKYILRAEKKGEYRRDLKKAQWYLNWYINNQENEEQDFNTNHYNVSGR